MNRALAVLFWVLPAVALADDGGDGGADASTEPQFDGSQPDASSGQGGADRDNPESQDSNDRVATSCRSSRDCNQGFSCENGRCVWTGYRKADRVGCLVGADGAGFAALGLALALKRRRRRSAQPLE